MCGLFCCSSWGRVTFRDVPRTPKRWRQPSFNLKGPVFDSEILAELPRVLDLYVAGAECIDRSGANRHPKKLLLKIELPADAGQSSKTLMASIKTIQPSNIRSFVLENVKGNWPVHEVVEFIRTLLPGFDIFYTTANAMDFGSRCDRHRVYILGNLYFRQQQPG